MKIVFLILLVTVASGEAAFARNSSIDELRRMFDYDQNLPLDVKEVGVRDSNGVRIHDINYAGRANLAEEIKHHQMKGAVTAEGN